MRKDWPSVPLKNTEQRSSRYYRQHIRLTPEKPHSKKLTGPKRSIAYRMGTCTQSCKRRQRNLSGPARREENEIAEEIYQV
jgi:hypothetical protein